MSVKERFDLLINQFANGNKREFSQKIGVSPTVIENIVGTRRGNPSFEVLQKVLYAFANINAEWIITGKEPMLHFQDNPVSLIETQNCEYKNKYMEQLEETIRLKDEIAALKNQISQQ